MHKAAKTGRKAKKPRSTPPRHRDLGEMLRVWREVQAPSMSKEGLADQIGRSMSTIQRWERGATVPDVEDLILLEATKGGLFKMLQGRVDELHKARRARAA